jgi:hypothetical protein
MMIDFKFFDGNQGLMYGILIFFSLQYLKALLPK